jgi:hypothetical protein
VRIRDIAVVGTIVVLSVVLTVGQEGATGLLIHDPRAWSGYTLLAPISSTTTYLIDMDGEVVHTWESDATAGNAVYLLENGNLLRTENDPGEGGGRFVAGGAGGRVREIAPDGTVVWEFVLSTAERRLHHDVERLPNGNVLMIAWEAKSVEEAVSAGRSPGLLKDDELWADMVIEVKPTPPSGGEIVWEWRVWDHLVQELDPSTDHYGDVAARPGRIDVNYVLDGGPRDWTHINSVAYNERLDQIVLSVHEFGEIWVIDHSTTNEQAAAETGGRYGRGGNLLYRWGNPRAYGAGDVGDQVWFGQHDAAWIDVSRATADSGDGAPTVLDPESGPGRILVFNNGMGRPEHIRPFSTVDEIATPLLEDGSYEWTPGEPYRPHRLAWRYRGDGFYSSNISGAQRLPNGNTLICEGASGRIFEVTCAGDVVWEYVNPFSPSGKDGPRSEVFKVRRYAPDSAEIVHLWAGL